MSIAQGRGTGPFLIGMGDSVEGGGTEGNGGGRWKKKGGIPLPSRRHHVGDTSRRGKYMGAEGFFFVNRWWVGGGWGKRERV